MTTTKKRTFTPIQLQKCPWHQSKERGYLSWHADAERRTKAGERQIQCHVCGFWFWPDEFGHDPIQQLLRPKVDSRVRLSQHALRSIQVPAKHHQRLGTVIRLSKDGNRAYVVWDGTKTTHPYAIAMIQVIPEAPTTSDHA